MSDNKPKYILCPRCELNYIDEEDGYCKVCKAEMGLLDPSILIPEEDELTGEKLCPICKVNYIGEDEEICFLCKRERDAKEAAEEENEDAWRDFVDDDVPEDDAESDILLSELEESEEDEEEEEDEEIMSIPDDFDYNIDPKDFDEDDEDEEEEEDAGDDEL